MRNFAHQTPNLDLFKPWLGVKNRNASPLKNAKNISDMHRNTFSNKMQKMSSKSKQDSLHTVFINHLNKHLPRFIDRPKWNGIKKENKHSENIIKKQNTESIERLLKRSKKNQLESKSNTRFSSYSENNINGNNCTEKVSFDIIPIRNRSVRTVIEKFNNLSKTMEFPTLKKNEKKVEIQEMPKVLPSEEKEEEKVILKCKINNTAQEKKSPRHKTSHRHVKVKENSGCRLRSQTVRYLNNEYCKPATQIIRDELLDLFRPPKAIDSRPVLQPYVKPKLTFDCKPTPRNTLQNVQLSPSELKHFVSIDTQTTPCPSGTNILINVYNNSTPRRNINNKITIPACNVVKEKVLQEEKDIINDNDVKVHISEEEIILIENLPKSQDVFDLSKSSVKHCIKQFEDHLTKKGFNNKELTEKKISSKIRSNYLLKNMSKPELSPRASSVPF